MKFSLVCLQYAIFFCLWAGTCLGSGADWPAFRGFHGHGHTNETNIFSDNQAITLSISWQKDLGSGYSGIAVVADQLFIAYSDGTLDYTIAIESDTGTTLWQTSLGPSYLGHDGSHSGPLATPAVADGSVIMLSPRGGLFCYATDSGQLRWKRDLMAEFKAIKPHYGFSASPQIIQGIVIVPIGGYQQAFAGFDINNGALKWKAGTDVVDYQSAVIGTLMDRQQFVAAGNSHVFGINPSDGALLWSYEHQGAGTRGAQSMSAVLIDEDRVLLAHRDDQSLLVGISADGSATKIWESGSIRNSYAVPLYLDGHFYAYSSRILSCIDATTGSLVWRSRSPGDGFPIIVDGHLVIQTKTGSIHIAKAQPHAYQELASLDVFNDVSWTSPSFSEGSIYARSMSKIARIDVLSRKPTTSTIALSDQFEEHELLIQLKELLRDPTTMHDAVADFIESHPISPIINGDQALFYFQGEAQDVAIAGDLVGARQEKALPRMANSDLFARSFRLEANAALSYAYIVDFKLTNDRHNPLTQLSMVYGPEFEPIVGGSLNLSWFAMPNRTAPSHLNGQTKNNGDVTKLQFSSGILKSEIPIAVYTPFGYNDMLGALPVIYIFAGSKALQTPLTSSFDYLIESKSVRPMIAVFILRDGGGASHAMAKMMTEELIPSIDQTYRTLRDAKARACVGMGWSASDAAFCALKLPTQMGHLAIQSLYALTTFDGGVQSLVTNPLDQKLTIYMDWGKYDLRNPVEAWSMADDNRRLFKVFEERGFEPSGGEVNEGSGWASWQARTDRWLSLFFPYQTLK